MDFCVNFQRVKFHSESPCMRLFFITVHMHHISTCVYKGDTVGWCSDGRGAYTRGVVDTLRAHVRANDLNIFYLQIYIYNIHIYMT